MTLDKTTRILIVDDDPGHLTTLKTITKSWGYTVETADDGTVAVARVKSDPLDLIVMDVRMTNMGGIEALEQIKKLQPLYSRYYHDGLFVGCGGG